MRITNQLLSENIVRQIQTLASRQAKLQTQVATGQRITQPEDDPSAVARVIDLTGEQRRIGQYLRNADRALAVSQASFASLQQIKRLSDRASEIATLGAGVISPSAGKAYAAELDQLVEQGVQLANARFGSDHLFAGTAVDQPPFVVERDAAGKVTSLAFVGNGESAPIPLSENASIAANASPETALALRDFFNEVIELRDALAGGDTAVISGLRTRMVNSEDRIVAALAEHGGVQTRIEASRAEQRDRADHLEGRVSAETDADLPSTIVKLNQAQLAYQAALQSGASIMRLSLLDYLQ